MKVRYNQHLRDKNKTHKAAWIRLLKKYGKKPVCEILQDNLTFDEALIQEVEFIRLFKSVRARLTNHALGGGGSTGYKWKIEDRVKQSVVQKIRFKNDPTSNGHRRDVYQFDLIGNFIKKFHSARHAASQTGTSQGNITQCCRGHRRKCGNFLWSYSMQVIPLRNIKYRYKPVNQFDLDGNFLRSFDSIVSAANELKLSQGNISLCCTGHRRKCGNFMWSFSTKINIIL